MVNFWLYLFNLDSIEYKPITELPDNLGVLGSVKRAPGGTCKLPFGYSVHITGSTIWV